jgi:Flp pilus assembly protein TadD
MRRPLRARRIAAPLLALALAVALAGCATWRGARLYTSGSEALERGDLPRAIAELEEASTLVPHASEVQNHLGLAYAAAGRDADALRAFRRAVDLDCDNAAAQENLAAAEAWLRRAERTR